MRTSACIINTIYTIIAVSINQVKHIPHNRTLVQEKDLQGGTKQKYTNMEDVRVLDEIEVDSKVDSTTSESEDSEEEIDVSIFGDSSGIADVVLIIEGTSIPVVKSVLSIASPVFKVMFTGDFAEKSQKGIDLPGKDLQSFLSFLRCIYPDHRDRVTDDTVLTILPLASEYQVKNLTAECEDCLISLIRRKIKSKKSISCKETCK
ncbi:BTB and MATH domain-containing protein 36-like [Dreissena polymorpha]|uniref:BTB and MATH domain-containing protein 36-like n=1 Tax=Dreissena polymorpha TaxID=45954 RepID=UPI002263D491|nr:BTB and MATH domain-containing protein 36-like [Dreissena polymorpha]